MITLKDEEIETLRTFYFNKIQRNKTLLVTLGISQQICVVYQGGNFTKINHPTRGIQHFGISGPHWKTKSCLGPHNKYADTNKNQ